MPVNTRRVRTNSASTRDVFDEFGPVDRGELANASDDVRYRHLIRCLALMLLASQGAGVDAGAASRW